MALLHTPAPQKAFRAPDFSLKNIDGKILNYSDIAGENGTVIAFICNHCPYVKAIITRMVSDFITLKSQGIGVAAIMPNDTQAYPDDSFENMQKFAKEHGFDFPYLIDETQQAAREYDAVCTPDLFGFDADGLLQYRGRLDSAGAKEAGAETNRELLLAMQTIAQGGAAPSAQSPSMGCSIKWR
jgi:peroxiredoxin